MAAGQDNLDDLMGEAFKLMTSPIKKMLALNLEDVDSKKTNDVCTTSSVNVNSAAQVIPQDNQQQQQPPQQQQINNKYQQKRQNLDLVYAQHWHQLYQQYLQQQNQAQRSLNQQRQTQQSPSLQYQRQQHLNRQYQGQLSQQQVSSNQQGKQHIFGQPQYSGRPFQDKQYRKWEQRLLDEQLQLSISSQQLRHQQQQQQRYNAQPSTSSGNGTGIPSTTDLSSNDVTNYPAIQQSLDDKISKQPSGAWSSFLDFNRNGQQSVTAQHVNQNGQIANHHHVKRNGQIANYQYFQHNTLLGSTSASSNQQSWSYGAIGGRPTDNYGSVSGQSGPYNTPSDLATTVGPFYDTPGNNMPVYATNSTSGNWNSWRFADNTSPAQPLPQTSGAKPCTVSIPPSADDAGLQMNQTHLMTSQMQSAAPRPLPIDQIHVNAHIPQYDEPTETFTEIIARIILNQVSKKIFLSDIYTAMEGAYPYFKSVRRVDWHGKVRHLLSSAQFFIKVGHRTARGRYWTVHPACVGQFQTNDFNRSRANRAIKNYNNAAGIQ